VSIICSASLTLMLSVTMQVAEGVYPDGEIKYKCASRGYTAWWQRKTYFTFLAAYILVVPAVIIIIVINNNNSSNRSSIVIVA